MIEKIRSYLLMLSFIVIAGGLMLYMYVLASGDNSLFGDSDGNLQPVDFETLAYAIGDDGHLLCDAGFCGQASADGGAEIFNIGASRLRQLIADFSDNQPTIETHNFNFAKNQFDFLERLPGETFPTVIAVRIEPINAFSSNLMLFAYKPVGSNSRESNQQRAERWMANLQDRATARPIN